MGRMKFADLDNVIPLFDRPGAIPAPAPVAKGAAGTIRRRGPAVDFHGVAVARGAFLYEEDSPREPWTARAPGDPMVARAVAIAGRAGWSRMDCDHLATTLMAKCPRAGGVRIGVHQAAFETGPERWAWVKARRG